MTSHAFSEFTRSPSLCYLSLVYLITVTKARNKVLTKVEFLWCVRETVVPLSSNEVGFNVWHTTSVQIQMMHVFSCLGRKQRLYLKTEMNISRIHHECKGGIEKSVPRITDWHHEACQVMTNGDRKGRIFLPHPHTNNECFFLLTTKYCILYSKNMKYAEM